jgi:hypothetical protein
MPDHVRQHQTKSSPIWIFAQNCCISSGNTWDEEQSQTQGPSIEVGMSMSQICMNASPPIEYLLETPHQCISNANEEEVVQWNWLMLLCSAAAGVLAGSNAPLAVVFFVLKIVEGAFFDIEQQSGAATADSKPKTKQGSLDVSTILVASILLALIFQSTLGNEIVLSMLEYKQPQEDTTE